MFNFSLRVSIACASLLVATSRYFGAVGLTRSALAQSAAAPLEMPFANGQRKLVAYPEKRPLIVLTSRPPQLETPFEVFDDGLLTPNDAFFVRYHNAGIPTSVDADRHVIRVGGNAAGKPYVLSLAELRTQFKPVEVVAVNPACVIGPDDFSASEFGRLCRRFWKGRVPVRVS